jgi:uncharacterized membrane protein (UPF0136 family)
MIQYRVPPRSVAHLSIYLRRFSIAKGMGMLWIGGIWGWFSSRCSLGYLLGTPLTSLFFLKEFGLHQSNSRSISLALLHISCMSVSFLPTSFSCLLCPPSHILSSLSPPPLSRPAQLILNKDPACRLGSRSSDDIFNHPFFASIDWTALNKRLIPPPFDPCKNLTHDLDTTNFEKEFTKLPMYSMEEIEAHSSSPNKTSAVGSSSYNNGNGSNGSPSLSHGPFSQFTFGEDSFLERIASR